MMDRNAKNNKPIFLLYLLGAMIFFVTPEKINKTSQLFFADLFSQPLELSHKLANLNIADNTHQYVPIDRYIQLRNQLANTKMALDQQRQKYFKLSAIKDRPAWQGVSFVIADVIKLSQCPSDKIIINRGKNDSLTPGQYVMMDNAVIGQISAVSPSVAQVNLITDPKSRIPVKIDSFDFTAVMHGHTDNQTVIKMLPAKYKLESDLFVYAAAQPGFLPCDVVTAQIQEIKPDPDNPLLWYIKASPACSLQNIRQVQVIVTDTHADNLIKTEQQK